MPGLPPAPCLSFHDRQRSVRFPLDRVVLASGRILPRVLRCAGPGEAVLGRLENVEVTFLGDRAMAALHRRFLGLPGPTDVITFPHGEILIGVAEAVRNARQFGEPLARELFRYVVHGLLHLQGFLDDAPVRARAMRRVQERLVSAGMSSR